MSVKFNRAASPRTLLTIADNAGLTFPNGDWTLGAIVVFDGQMDTGATSQYLFRTGEYQQAGHLSIFWNGTAGANPGRFQSYLDTSGAGKCLSPAAVEAGKAYFVGLVRANGAVYSKLCPVLAQAPGDGSAVLTGAGSSGTQAVTVALDGPGALIIGGRNAADRQFDHSVCRVFRVDQALTDAQIAQLAYGREVSDIATPQWYLRLSGPSDLGDAGAQANLVTASGTFAQGAEPGFGFVSTPVAPSITGKPAIDGGPQVNVATSYTKAPVSGTPLPVVSQQWTLDGVDIPDATGTTYTPATADTGKALRVRQVASNGSGPAATSTSDPAVVANGTVTVDVTPPPAEAIYHAGVSGAVVPFSGSWSGLTAPAKIEFQLYAANTGAVARAWTDIGAAIIAGGTWTAAPLVPRSANGKKYRCSVRSLDGAGNVLSASSIKTNRFGVGFWMAYTGSSSATAITGAGTGNSFMPDHDAGSALVGEVGTLAFAQLGTAGVAVQIANYFAEQFGVPVGVISAGVSGDTLDNWTKTNSASWQNFAAKVAFVGGKLGTLFATMGSNDATNASLVTSRAGHAAKIRLFIQNVRTLTGQPDLDVMWQGYNRRTTGTAGKDALSDYVRMAENDVGGDPNVWHTQTLDAEIVGDGIHLVGTELARVTTRSMYVWAAARKGNYRRGPRIASINTAGTTTVTTVQHQGSSTLTPSTGATGFTAQDANGNELTVVSASVTGANQITHVWSGTPTAVQYLRGPAPAIGTPVYGDGDPVLPMLVETDLPVSDGPPGPGPEPVQTIDATKVPPERRVVFEGSKRVISFEGSIRKVIF